MTDATFPDPNGYNNRKAILIIRQNLDDAKEAMIAEHGTGMINLAQRPGKDALITDMQYRLAVLKTWVATMRGLGRIASPS